jgi:hypothetical protein
MENTILPLWAHYPSPSPPFFSCTWQMPATNIICRRRGGGPPVPSRASPFLLVTTGADRAPPHARRGKLQTRTVEAAARTEEGAS